MITFISKKKLYDLEKRISAIESKQMVDGIKVDRLKEKLGDALCASHMESYSYFSVHEGWDLNHKMPINEVIRTLLDHLNLEIKTEPETTKLVKKTEVKK